MLGLRSSALVRTQQRKIKQANLILMISSNLNSKLFRFYCVTHNLGAYVMVFYDLQTKI